MAATVFESFSMAVPASWSQICPSEKSCISEKDLLNSSLIWVSYGDSHKLGPRNSRNVFSDSSGGQEPGIKVQAGVAPPRGCEVSCLPCRALASGLVPGLAIPGLHLSSLSASAVTWLLPWVALTLRHLIKPTQKIFHPEPN